LGGGCSLPVGALAEVQGKEITLRGVIAAPDGSRVIGFSTAGCDPVLVGQELAHKALVAGARAYIPDGFIEKLQ